MGDLLVCLPECYRPITHIFFQEEWYYLTLWEKSNVISLAHQRGDPLSLLPGFEPAQYFEPASEAAQVLQGDVWVRGKQEPRPVPLAPPEASEGGERGVSVELLLWRLLPGQTHPSCPQRTLAAAHLAAELGNYIQSQPVLPPALLREGLLIVLLG